MPKITVVIVSWNVSASLGRCLKSIIDTGYPSLQLIVVDNASTDDTVVLLKKYPQVNLLTNSTNIGFPKAVNQGLKIADGELVVILNPDTQVQNNFFSDSLAFFKNHPDAALMGPKFVNPDGSVQGSVFPEPSLITAIQEFWLNQGPLTQKYAPTGDEPVSVNSVSGGCFILPKKMLDQIGLLTEQVFMYYEDLDYCRRIRQSGLKIYFNPAIKILHEHGQSSKQSQKSLGYLKSSSRWYNGAFKDFLLWFISWTGQKLHSGSR